MENKKNKLLTGFTIIELIVVIAIVAVLASIVLVNVTKYINKGKDAAIKGDLSTLATNAIIYYDDTSKGNGDYSGFTADTTIGCNSPISTAITNAGGSLVCAETATTGAAWCGCSQLKDDTTKYFCVDSTGARKESTTTCTTSCTTASPDC
jgi:prepilin-type N-terminal cleavage/methylation domain-containing protein